MAKAALVAIASVLALGYPQSGAAQELKPMDPAAHPHFEVATIKPTDPADRNAGFHITGQRIFIENERMSDVASFAYDVHTRQMVNAPEWFSSDHYDIHGVADVPGVPSLKQQQEMVRALLEERLGLVFHREERSMPRFALVVLPSGAKLTATQNSTDALPDQTGSVTETEEVWRFTNNSMADLANFLRGVLDRPVVDQTGLAGRFDFRLRWRREASTPGDPNPLSGVVSALPEQAGLKVETAKGPLPMLIIDRVSRPSDN